MESFTIILKNSKFSFFLQISPNFKQKKIGEKSAYGDPSAAVWKHIAGLFSTALMSVVDEENVLNDSRRYYMKSSISQ